MTVHEARVILREERPRFGSERVLTAKRLVELDREVERLKDERLDLIADMEALAGEDDPRGKR